jgi:hypothetical protein
MDFADVSDLIVFSCNDSKFDTLDPVRLPIFLENINEERISHFLIHCPKIAFPRLLQYMLAQSEERKSALELLNFFVVK